MFEPWGHGETKVTWQNYGELPWPIAAVAKQDPPAPEVPARQRPPRALSSADTPAQTESRNRDHAADARRLANEGRFDEALAACNRALAADKLVAAHHYLRGIILQEQSTPDDAVEAFRRALYLDPDFVIAYFALGHLLLRQSHSGEAARCFANARALLRNCPPDAVLPDSDGITAGRLLEILVSMEETLA